MDADISIEGIRIKTKGDRVEGSDDLAIYAR